MFQEILEQIKGKKNIVFLGEAGSGKSEIAINFACALRRSTGKAVHFFDLDMTKPLYRSRDVCSRLEKQEIEFHFEPQFADAPTAVGGVLRRLKDPDCFAVMDVGGDYIGARALGAYAPQLNAPQSLIYCVINPFRPWSDHLEHIDRTLGEILGVSHIHLEQVHILANPNTGAYTTAQEFLDGCRRVEEMISPYKPIEFACVRQQLYPQVCGDCALALLPIELYLSYDWLAVE